MDDQEKMMSLVAELIEQLQSNVSSPHDEELITDSLLNIAKSRTEARSLIGSHCQALPLFVSILRSGNMLAKINVAATISVICKDDDLRVKVLLSGCVPPLLSLLKSDVTEARKAASEAIYQVSAGRFAEDHVGSKILSTEAVVPILWEQLNTKNRQDRVVEGFITGALRNLCGEKEGYWQATLNAGGIGTIVDLLTSGNTSAQSHSASLLARLALVFTDRISKLIDPGTIKALIVLLGEQKDVSVRVSAAEALEVLSLKSTEAKKAIVDAHGVPVLIGAIIAPSKEGMQGDAGQVLQQRSTQTLQNLCGGMPELILYLGELSQSQKLAAPVADVIGALAYSLMVFKQIGDKETVNSRKIETILVTHLKPRGDKLVQERLFEALASLYSNVVLSTVINQSEAKGVLIGLITMALGNAQEYFILCLKRLCSEDVSLWEALGKKEGIQLLISSMGLSSEQYQEYAIKMLTILTEEVDDCKWAITASGGIPPLVRLLVVGSRNVSEGAACVLWHLCCHSEDVRACVESAGAISGFLWLLRNGGTKGQEASAKALIKLLRTGDSATINNWLTFILSDSLDSKYHHINVLGHLLSLASHRDLVDRRATANKGLRSLVQVLNSPNENIQEHAASILVDLLNKRQDLCDSPEIDEVVNPFMKLLTSKTQGIVALSARALLAVSRPSPSKSKSLISYLAERDIKPLMILANNLSIDTAETALATLANLLSDRQIAAEALAEDIISAIMRVLSEGSPEGKKSASRALLMLLKHFPVCDVFIGSAQYQFIVLAIVDSLNRVDLCGEETIDALEILAVLFKKNDGRNSIYQPWSVLDEFPSSLECLGHYLHEGPPSVQDKTIEILSCLCSDRPVVLGDFLASNFSWSIGALADRILKSCNPRVKVGGAVLLASAALKHKSRSMDALQSSGYLTSLVRALVGMIKRSSGCYSLEIGFRIPGGIRTQMTLSDGIYLAVPDMKCVWGCTVALWLLSIVSSSHPTKKVTVVAAEGLEALFEKFAEHTENSWDMFEETEGIWISALLAAILFQNVNVVSSPTVMRLIPSLAILLNSKTTIHKFFAAQAMASLVSHGNMGINLVIANSGAIAGLIALTSIIEFDMPELVALSEEFLLVRNPDQVVLKSLFQIDDVRVGSIARKSIPFLVDLLRPKPERLRAPPFAVHLLTEIAIANDANKLVIAEAGALDALTKYLSLSPQDPTEEAICELMRILFTNPEILQYEASIFTMNQLIAVLHLGSRSSRLSAARALNELFENENIRHFDGSIQAVQPLVNMLDSHLEHEQQDALKPLLKLTSENNTKAAMAVDVENNLLRSLCRILSHAKSFDLKHDAVDMCYTLFNNSRTRELPIASECMEHLIMLMQVDDETVVESAVCTFERLLEDEQKVEVASAHDLVSLLVRLLSRSNMRLLEASLCALVKLGKDRTPLKLDMVNAGIIDYCLELLPTAHNSLSATIAELFRILTNTGAVSRSSLAAKIVEPLFVALLRPDFGLWEQHSALQALVNVLEKTQCLVTWKLTPRQVIEPLISFLDSRSLAIQQLSTELLSHLLAQEHFKKDITTKNAVTPLVQLAGIGILNLQQTAIKALENISLCWPKAVSDAGGIFELSKLIVQDDPLPPDSLWESTASILCNILQSDSNHNFEVPIVVLVKMLQSTQLNTITVALNALIVQEKTDTTSAELMAEAGVINALLNLLMSHHQCERASCKLLEALFNNTRVREMKASKYAIAPLAQYLLDPQTRSQTGRLLATLALGDLSQNEVLARASDSVSACRALVNLLEDQTTDEMKIVVICALQNFVMHSKKNRRAVAEAGGVLVIQELLLARNSEVTAQASLLIKLLFSNHSLQEYVSNELIRSLTAALEKEMWSTGSVNQEVLKTINIMFSNFEKLHISEAATLCIPHLIEALKLGNEAAQHSVLTTLLLLKQSWSTMPIEVSKSQAIVAAEAIPFLQLLRKNCSQSFHERLESLLNSLPGCLTVTIIRANNLKQVIGGTNAFCRLTVDNGPAKQTKVVSHNSSPEWKEVFTWSFDVPPKGQKLLILCLSKNTFGKTTFGKVTIGIDRVVTEGTHSGLFNLSNDSNKDNSSRTLEIDISWSNMLLLENDIS